MMAARFGRLVATVCGLRPSKIVWGDCPWLWLHVDKFLIAYNSKIGNMPVTPTELFFPTYITMK